MSGSQENTGQWFEPETPYATIKGKAITPRDNASKSTVYPFNKITETESGHIVEFDDTPGAERVHLFHRSGTFEEIHPNGDKVDKIVRDQYVSVLRDSNVHIDGFSNITVDKGMKIYVNRDNRRNTENSSINFDVHIGQNSNVNLFLESGNCNVRMNDGDMNIEMLNGDVNFRQNKGNYNHFINGDYNLECTGHMHVVVGKDSVNEIGGSRDVRIDGKFDNLQVTKGYKETQVKGDHRLEVFGGVYDLFHKSHETKIKMDRIVHIFGDRDQIIEKNDTLNVNTNQNETVKKNKTSTTEGSLNVLTKGSTRETTNGSLDIKSGKKTTMSSTVMHLNGGPAIVGTASVIHLNGPKASTAKDAKEAKEVDKKPEYEPGEGGKWVTSTPTHPRSPIGKLQNVSTLLSQKLVEVSGASSEVAKASEKVASLRASSTTISSLGPADVVSLSGFVDEAKEATQITSDVAGNVANVAASTQALANKAVSAISDATTGGTSATSSGVAGSASTVTVGAGSSVTNAIASGTEATSDLIENAAASLNSTQSIFSGIGSVIGDIVGAIVDIACFIADLISGVLKFISDILNKIGSVFKMIADMLGEILKVVGNILNFIGNLIGSILGAINSLLNDLLNAAGKFISDILSGINDLFGGLGNLLDCGKKTGSGTISAIGNDSMIIGAGLSLSQSPYGYYGYGSGFGGGGGGFGKPASVGGIPTGLSSLNPKKINPVSNQMIAISRDIINSGTGNNAVTNPNSILGIIKTENVKLEISDEINKLKEQGKIKEMNTEYGIIPIRTDTGKTVSNNSFTWISVDQFKEEERNRIKEQFGESAAKDTGITLEELRKRQEKNCG